MKENCAKKASLTVECALVLPLFLFLLLPLLAFPQALALQAEGNLKLANLARQLSAAAQLSGGESWIDLQETGSYRLPSPALPLTPLALPLRARVYPFTGYAPGSDDADGEAGGGEEMVFVTDTESVYHSYADCTHLSLSVFSTTAKAAASMRNAYGRKYRPCPGFPRNYEGAVYLTEKGDYYYPSADYGSLVRHVRLVSKADCQGLAHCRRCAARAEEALDAAA